MGDNPEYSGIDYGCFYCGRVVPLMVPFDALQGGKRFLLLARHPKNPQIPNGLECPGSETLVKVAEVIPAEQPE